MKRLVPVGIISLLITWSFLLAGCSSDSPTTAQGPEDLNLVSDFGGYTAEDEAPAFGDPELADLLRGDPSFADDLLGRQEFEALSHLSGATVYALAIRWGALDGDRTIAVMTDWSGGVELKYGGIQIRNIILFELGQDYIVRPRTDRRIVEWVSMTSVHYDGVLLAIIVPPAPEGDDWSDNEVVFKTPPYTRTFALSELDALSEIVDVGDGINQVSFNARRITRDLCGAGTMDGRWLFNPSGRNGNFLGRWMSDDGLLAGHLRGHFGVRGANHDMVFFGKAIGMHGEFLGLLRGTWGYDAASETEGWYEGILASREGLPVGEVRGTWASVVPADDEMTIGGPRDGDHNRHNPREHPDFGTHRQWTRGFFSGIWVKDCPANGENAE